MRPLKRVDFRQLHARIISKGVGISAQTFICVGIGLPSIGTPEGDYARQRIATAFFSLVCLIGVVFTWTRATSVGDPVRIGWFAVVFPALLLNYLGQGAYLLSGAPIAGGKLFYSLAPASLLLPLVPLATCATIVASQALISGAFSLIWQAVGLGLFPRVDVRHTHQAHAGQIYIPIINWGLYAGCIALVATFRSLVITSATMFVIAKRYWRLSSTRTFLVWGPLAAINAAFLVASSVKFMEGGYVPIAVGVLAFLIMATWRWGRKAFGAYAARSTLSMFDVVTLRRPGMTFLKTNALMVSTLHVRQSTDRAPALVGLLWERYGIMPRNLVLVEVLHPKVPYIP